MEKKAVVLGGGGSRGSYQIGVWQALRELGYDYEIVTGTSVGALNGAMMVQGEYDLALCLWQGINTQGVMDIPVGDRVEGVRDLTGKLRAFLSEMVKNGGADPRPLEQMLRAYVDEDKIRLSPVDFSFVTVEYPTLEAKLLHKQTVPPGQLVDYLMASAACFPAMKARAIGDKTYIDGGYWDNLPVQAAVDMGAGEIVAVDLEAIGVVRRVAFPHVRLRYLKSHWDLGMFLLFDSGRTERNIRLGYLDTQKLFGKKEGCAYTFFPGQTALLSGRIRKESDLLLARSGMYLIPGNAYPAQARARRKLCQLLDRLEGRIPPQMVTLACCEAAARLLGVDPLVEYTAEQMEEAVLAAYGQYVKEARQLPAVLADRSAKELAAHLKGLERRLVLLYCCRCLDEMMEGHFSPTAARALCSAVTEEFLAAMYLCALRLRRKKTDPQKDG